VVVGSGIFVLPAYVAAQLPHPAAFVLVWQMGALLALCSAVSYAELSTTFPETGGYVVFLRRIYGSQMAFVYGWAAMLVLYPSSIAGLARVTGRSMVGLAGFPEASVPYIAALSVAAATALNLVRVARSTRVQGILSTAKVGALLVLALAGLAAALGLWTPPGSPAGADPSGAIASDPPGSLGALGAGAWFLGLVGVLWCYEGFLEIVVVAGEVRRPARTLVRALVGSVLLVALAYGAYSLALLLELGLPAVIASPTVGADLARALFGATGSVLVNLVVLVATFSAAQALLFSGPRLLVGLAEGGLIPASMGRVDHARGVPVVAVLLCGAVALLYALVGSFEELVKYFAFATGLFSSLIVAGGVWLRVRGRVPREARRIPLWPLPPLLAILGALGGSFWVLRDQPRSSLIGLGILALALPLARRSRGTGSFEGGKTG
jgi:APA family basic amino acid/polyamine antiporter